MANDLRQACRDWGWVPRADTSGNCGTVSCSSFIEINIVRGNFAVASIYRTLHRLLYLRSRRVQSSIVNPVEFIGNMGRSTADVVMSRVVMILCCTVIWIKSVLPGNDVKGHLDVLNILDLVVERERDSSRRDYMQYVKRRTRSYYS
jgi:hypothetical protein